MELKKRILVAPLNWGLGHATRCIPIINALISCNFEPLIASDGASLAFLQKEFPNLESIELPSYNIEYSKNAKHLKRNLIINSPKIYKAIQQERKLVAKLVKENYIDGIISDNRFGVFNNKAPSVYITHQLNVLSGKTTWLSSKIHQKIIKKYDQCWVPDVEVEPSLSGELGHLKTFDQNIIYLGAISRFKKLEVAQKYDLLILLSGPEPQRTFLEEKLLKQIDKYVGKVLFIKGVVEEHQKIEVKGNLTLANFMTSSDLELAINESKLVLSRSGYSTILDLANLEKKAFFIPTPGQFEQEYLAQRFEDNGIAPFANQDNFRIEELERTNRFNGFQNTGEIFNLNNLFSLFKSE